MKKYLTLALALLLMFSVSACGTFVPGDGHIFIRQNISEEEMKEKAEIIEGETVTSIVYADTLNEAILSLKSGKAGLFITNDATAKYLAARDEALRAEVFSYPTTLHIISLFSNTQLNAELNEAILALEADGTLERLYDQHVTAVIEGGEPKAVTLPDFNGAETVIVGVSGDIPPIDYVDADGNPAGYNMAVLAELAATMKKNIKVEIIDSGNRFAALSAGRIDAFFWQISPGNMDLAGAQMTYALSEPYATVDLARVYVK